MTSLEMKRKIRCGFNIDSIKIELIFPIIIVDKEILIAKKQIYFK